MSCGFSNFPTLGLGALQWGWNFDFQLIYVGAGIRYSYKQLDRSLICTVVYLCMPLEIMPCSRKYRNAYL